jgi:hypothetical protein
MWEETKTRYFIDTLSSQDYIHENRAFLYWYVFLDRYGVKFPPNLSKVALFAGQIETTRRYQDF